MPALALDELGPLGRKEKSRVTAETVKELTHVLNQNQRATHVATWYVDGKSGAVLAEAVKNVSGSLSSHSFRLINPIGNTAQLIESLNNKKAKFEGEFFKYDRSRASLMMIGKQKDELLQAMGKLPAGKNYDVVTRRYIVDTIDNLSRFGKKAVGEQSKLTAKNKTFVQLLKTAGAFRK